MISSEPSQVQTTVLTVLLSLENLVGFNRHMWIQTLQQKAEPHAEDGCTGIDLL